MTSPRVSSTALRAASNLLATLRPGDRVRLRDWRDRQWYEATFLCHVQRGSGVLYTCVRAGAADGVSVQRDCFCGTRVFYPGDRGDGSEVVLLRKSTDHERLRRLVSQIEAEATRCSACAAFVEESPVVRVRHVSACVGVALVPFVEAALRRPVGGEDARKRA